MIFKNCIIYISLFIVLISVSNGSWFGRGKNKSKAKKGRNDSHDVGQSSNNGGGSSYSSNIYPITVRGYYGFEIHFFHLQKQF